MQWFKHDSNANGDDKLQNVLLDYGLEGYGLYWYCLELIVNRVDKDNITFELKHDARIIARNTGSTDTKVQEMMKRFVELGLFENSEGAITCLKLLRRMDSSMTSNKTMREIILNANNNHDAVMTQSANVMQEKNRIEEIRRDKSRDKPKKTASFIPPIDSTLLDSWLIVRRAKRAGIMTKIAWDGLVREASKAGITPEQAVTICCERSWTSFNSSWNWKPISNNNSSLSIAEQNEQNKRKAYERLFGNRGEKDVTNEAG